MRQDRRTRRGAKGPGVGRQTWRKAESEFCASTVDRLRDEEEGAGVDDDILEGDLRSEASEDFHPDGLSGSESDEDDCEAVSSANHNAPGLSIRLGQAIPSTPVNIGTPRGGVSSQDMGIIRKDGVQQCPDNARVDVGDAMERRWSVGCVGDLDLEQGEVRQRWRYAHPPTQLTNAVLIPGIPPLASSAGAENCGAAGGLLREEGPSATPASASPGSDFDALNEMKELKISLIAGSVKMGPVVDAGSRSESLEGGRADADASAGRIRMRPSDYDFVKLVGQGGFGKVFLVRRKSDNVFLALKVMRKEKLIEKSHSEYIRMERDVLTRVQHPYIVTLHASFQTTSKLYLVLDFINGGHLFFQLYKQGTFLEPLAAIYTAEIVLAISYLHELGIIHRDLKPENILLDFGEQQGTSFACLR